MHYIIVLSIICSYFFNEKDRSLPSTGIPHTNSIKWKHTLIRKSTFILKETYIYSNFVVSTWVFYCFELCFQINVKKTLIASRTKEGLKSSKLYFKFCILEARIVKKVCKKQPERNNVVHKIFSVYSSSIFYIRTKSIFGIKCEIFIIIQQLRYFFR